MCIFHNNVHIASFARPKAYIRNRVKPISYQVHALQSRRSGKDKSWRPGNFLFITIKSTYGFLFFKFERAWSRLICTKRFRNGTERELAFDWRKNRRGGCWTGISRSPGHQFQIPAPPLHRGVYNIYNTTNLHNIIVIYVESRSNFCSIHCTRHAPYTMSIHASTCASVNENNL